MITNIWIVVLILATLLVTNVKWYFLNKTRINVTITSLDMIKKNIQYEIISNNKNEEKTLSVKILSANGSRNLPKFDIWLKLLAIKPSRKSVTDAITNIINEKKIELFSFEKKKNKKNGTKIILMIDKVFGIIYISRLPSIALISVASSVYSKSPPTGMPLANLDILISLSL